MFGAALGAGKRLSIAACTYILKFARVVPQSLSLQVLLLGLNAWLFYGGAWRIAGFSSLQLSALM